MILFVDYRSSDFHEVDHRFLYHDYYRTIDNRPRFVVYNFTCFWGMYHDWNCLVMDLHLDFTIEKSQKFGLRYNDHFVRNLNCSVEHTDAEVVCYLQHLSWYWDNFETDCCILVCFSYFT